MVSKVELIQKFQKEQPDYWKVDLFERKGFVRKKCSKCGKMFWTLDKDRKNCPDPPCENYGFLGNPPTKKRFDYIESWKKIEKFFMKNKHTSVRRYPVVARWRPDLFFNIASIIDFQRIDNGTITFEFPTNPLIVPQMCLRFNDIPNVGVTGRHSTAFVMIGQHALANKEGYWKDKCIDLDFELLAKVFGIPEKEVIFLEDAWIGYGAFGLSLEYFVRGLEIGNAVFTEFLGDLNNYRPMKDKVVDMGAGLERFNWITQGTPTIYDCVFGPVIEKLKDAISVKYDKDFFLKYAKLAGSLNITEVFDIKKAKAEVAKQLKVSVQELEKKVASMEALYAIADHTKALVFAIADGELPSNVGGGYNLRVILRRALSFIDKFNWPVKLEDVAVWHIDYLKKMFPELAESKEEIVKILQVEEKKYKETKQRISRIIESLGQRILSGEELTKLYESDGITPEELGVEVPGDFYQRITEKHMGEKVEEEKKFSIDVSGLPETKILYYDEPYVYNFKAKVLKVSGSLAVLTQTAFYPASGGQDHDTGYISNAEVVDVQKIGNVIVHQIKGSLREGEFVDCKVNKDRREILMKHHDAIHIVSGSAKKILGKHIHQHGSEKTVEKARIDLTHFESPSDEELEKIENLANEVVKKDLPIKKTVMDRSEAEKKYGFDIYAGGYIPSKKIRIVDVGNGFDVEACGGTHENKTRDVGWIKIIKSKRVADGLVRLEIVSGEVAEEYLKEKEKILKEVAKKLGVKEEKVVSALKNMFEKWKKLRKEIKGRKK